MSTPNTPTTNTTKTAYAYSRFSTVQQADGDSKRRQESLSRAWPEASDYEIKYLHDAGISAYSGKNRTIGQFGVFLASLRSGRLGVRPVLLVENLDRISREELETAQALFLEIVGLGATIITLHNGKRYAKGMGLVDIITALVEMDVAHQHSAKLSMRVKAAVEARKRSGGIIHNRSSAPSWLRLDAKRTHFEPIPERVAIVRRIFDLAAKGVGPASISRILNTERVATWSARKLKHSAWRETTVSKILFGRSVLGEFEGRANYFGEPVVPPELWAQVNDRTRREAQGRGKGVVTESNLLCGLVVSGLDGSKMILRRSGVRHRKTKEITWHAYLASNETIAGRSSHRIKYDKVEGLLLWAFSTMDPQILARARSGVRDDTQDRLDERQFQIDEASRQIAKYRRLIENDPDPSMTLVLELKRHETEFKEAQENLSTLQVQSAKANEVPVVPDDLTKPETRRALRAEIAQWCKNIEVFAEDLVIWFTADHGIRIPLEGEPKLFIHEKDAPVNPEEEVMPDAATGEPEEEMALTAATDNYYTN